MTEEEFENEVYFRRLEGGLYTLQLVDYIILETCTSGPTSIKQRTTQILNLRGGSLKTIRQIMRGKFTYDFVTINFTYKIFRSSLYFIIFAKNMLELSEKMVARNGKPKKENMYCS